MMPSTHLPPGRARNAHGPSSSIADFRPHSNSPHAFGQQQPSGPPHMTGPQPGMAGNTGSVHRRNGVGHGSSGSVMTRDTSGATKNTSHVPCKFFRQGTCQAGRGCQFSHAIDTVNNPLPCKYYQKGNCKYGFRCANPHINPDGSDERHLHRNRSMRQPFSSGQADFSNELAAQEGFPEHLAMNGHGPTHAMPIAQSRDFQQFSTSPYSHPYDYTAPTDSSYGARGPMQYGSPGGELQPRHLPISPPIRAMDATIPETFQSNPSSSAALGGPWPASVPSRFGIGPASATTSTATSTAFANLGYMARPEANGRTNGNRTTDLGSSPPVQQDNGGAFAKRILHSDRLRQHQPLASSLPMSRPQMRGRNEVLIGDSDDEESFDLLPGALGDEIMTPAERLRRFSRSHEDAPPMRGGYGGLAFGSPPDPSSKFGSPPNMSLPQAIAGSSPSRWGLSNRKQREEAFGGYNGHNGDLQSYGSSPHGPIGSPLRNSSLPPVQQTRSNAHNEIDAPTASPSIRPIARPPSSHLSGDVSPFGMHSPPDRRGGLGMLGQQLKNTRLRDSTTQEATSTLHPQSARSISNSSVPSSSGRLDRAVSATSISRSDRIDEEPSMFEMDESDQARSSLEGRAPWSGSNPDLDASESGRSSPGSALGMGMKRGSTAGRRTSGLGR